MIRGAPLNKQSSFGFPPPAGKHFYRSEEANALFVVDTRYELQRLMGMGINGVVCSAIDTETNEQVAVKKNRDVFSQLGTSIRVLREIRILKQIDHPNFPKLKDVMLPTLSYFFQDVYFVQELMDNDLRTLLIQGHGRISKSDCKHILFQLLRGLEYLHARNVLHRDLKPANILINENMDIKICDFGLARTATDLAMTSRVVSLSYRAPELLLQVVKDESNRGNYDAAIDVWSVGCIFAQLLRGGSPNILFAGNSEIAKLQSISEMIPKPDDDDLDFIQDSYARQFVKEYLGPPIYSLYKKYRGESEEAIDLLFRMLVFNPRDRITVADALRHPYLAEEYNRAPPQTFPDHPIEEGHMPRSVYEALPLVYQEMLSFHPQ